MKITSRRLSKASNALLSRFGRVRRLKVSIVFAFALIAACNGTVSSSDSIEHFESGLTCVPPAPASPFEDSEPIPPPDPLNCNPPMDNPGGTNGTRGVRR